jgi:hypothetical protein
MAVHRNRVIYQSEALFISPDATGYHYTGASGLETIAGVGDGPFGLMTPPTSGRQTIGGSVLAPAKNNNGQAVGWQEGDAWPEWNPGNAAGAKAQFDGKVVKSDEVENISIVSNETASVTINGDGKKDLATLLGAAHNLTVGDGTLIPDNLAAINIADGQAESKAFHTIGAVTYTATLDGSAGDDITVTHVDANQALAVAEDVGAKTVTITGDFGNAGTGIPTEGDIVNAVNATLTLVTAAASTGVGNNATTANSGDQLDDGTAGQDEVKASFNGNVNVENKTVDVKIVSNGYGTAGNFTINFDGSSKLSVLVGSQGTVDTGGETIFPANTPDIVIEGGDEYQAIAHGTIIKQLKRVQSANYGFTINRQDINQFGHASRLDAVIVESPTVNLDFSYYLLDGYNERMLEFVTNGITNTLSGSLTPELYQAGNNFFILTTPESRDAVAGDTNLNAEKDWQGNSKEETKSVISLGNGYVTDYSVDIAVGAIPTVNVTVEGMNIKADLGTTGNDLPAVDMKDGSKISAAWGTGANGAISKGKSRGADGCTGLYSLPASDKFFDGCGDVAALRPGDVVVDLANKSLISQSVSGNANKPIVGSAHVQSVNMSLPLARTSLQRLGSTFGFSKAIDLPMTATFSVSALVSDLKEGNMLDLLCDCEEFEVGVTIFNPECTDCTVKSDESNIAMRYTLKGARLESENFSSTIGDNKTVDLVFSTQVGSSDDQKNGLYISGSEAAKGSFEGQGLPPAWTGVGGQTLDAASGFLFGYRP